MRPKGNALRNAGSNGKRATFVSFDFLDGRKLFAKDRLRSFAAVPKGLNPCLLQRMLSRFRGRCSLGELNPLFSPAPDQRAVSPRGRHGRACGSRTRSEEHTSELQSLMRISYAVFCLKKNSKQRTQPADTQPRTWSY